MIHVFEHELHTCDKLECIIGVGVLVSNAFSGWGSATKCCCVHICQPTQHNVYKPSKLDIMAPLVNGYRN